MSFSAIMLLIIMGSFSGAAIMMYFSAKQSGQFDDIEGIKYRMLTDEE